MAEKETKPNGKGEQEVPLVSTFDDSDFFTSEGVTEDEEKDAIRSRARVLRYAAYRAKKDEETAGEKPVKSSKGGKSKPWYKGD